MIHRRHFRPIAILLGSNAVSATIIFGGSIVVSRIVAPAEFGKYSYAAQVAISIYPVLTLRYEQALPLVVNRRAAYSHLLLGTFVLLAISTIMLLLFGGFAASILPVLGASPELGKLFPLVIMMAFSLAAVGIFQSASLAHNDVMRMAIARVLRAIAMVALQVVFVLTIDASAARLMVADLTANLVQAAILGSGIGLLGTRALLASPWPRLWPRFSVLAKRQRAFPLFTLPHILIYAGLGLLFTTVLGQLYGAEALGQYYLMRKLVFGVLALFGTAIYQHSIAEAARVPRTQVYDVAIRALIMVGGVTAISASVIILIGPTLFVAAAGAKWAMAGRIARASASLILMETLTSAFAFVPVFLGLQRTAFAVALVQGSVGVATLALASRLGSDVISAITISSLATAAVMATYVLWLLQQARRLKGIEEHEQFAG
jgi:O-antigen/teichoic acid export membrane protein